jgi:uncharacterized membrane protein
MRMNRRKKCKPANRPPLKRITPAVDSVDVKEDGVATEPEALTGVQIRHQKFEGPLPPPSILEGYDRVLPGAAERIMQMTEKSLNHQQEINYAALTAASREGRAGQWFAFIIALSALVTGAFAIFSGHPVAGATIVSTTLAGGVGTFIISKRGEQEK